MPRKIRQLISDLVAAGFVDRGGKGSHRNFVHPRVTKPVTLAGKRCQAIPGTRRQVGDRGVASMKPTACYAKIVEWSDEDACYIGSCPGLFYGGCHGDDERAVFAELCELVEETLELYQREGRPLPPSTAGKDYANRMLSLT